MTDAFSLIHGNALAIPLADQSVHLIVTSPPYFALRSYRDDDEHFDGQLGSETTPHHFLAALWAVLDECHRVLRDDGSCWINLGDKFAGSGGHNNAGISKHGYGASTLQGNGKPDVARRTALREQIKATRRTAPDRYNQNTGDLRAKSRMLLPHRFALGLIDPEYRAFTEHRVGLTPTAGAPQWICRMDAVWSKLNGLPESVTDRVRASHEYWLHFTKSERYFAAMDEIREEYASETAARYELGYQRTGASLANQTANGVLRKDGGGPAAPNVLGKLPGSVWSVATEPLSIPDHLPQHFACVDEATEILTTRGWLRHDELSEGDTVAGYNLDTGIAEWTTCHAVHRYEHSGPMVAVDKRDLSMRLTPNHRCLAEKATWPGEFRGAMQVVDAADLTSRHFIPRSAEWMPYERKSIGENLAALLGWVSAEGWFGQYGESVYLSQSKTANPEKVVVIDALLADLTAATEMGETWRRSEAERTYRGRSWTNVTWRLPRGLCQTIRRLLPGKLLTWEMLGLPENERRALLDAFIDGDGHRRPDGRIGIFQKLGQNLDVLQAIAVTLGYKTTLRFGRGRWVLYLTTGGRSITLRGTNGTNAPIPSEHHEGIVWCPTTGTGTFIARRNGSVFITGNSFPSEFPRRIVLGWSPSGVCVACEEPRRPICESVGAYAAWKADHSGSWHDHDTDGVNRIKRDGRSRLDPPRNGPRVAITGYACACPTPDAPTRPSVVLDPFSGTGTAPIVAAALGRHGIGVDLSWDYHRIARWRDRDGGLRAKALGVDRPEKQVDGQASLFDGIA